jgi:regulator of nucleoside diphosphate kinase
MTINKIMITEADLERLRRLIDSARKFGQRDLEHIDSLEYELDRAIIKVGEAPASVVALGSWVRLKDLDSKQNFRYQIVLPKDSDVAENRISVLAPIGTGLLGYRVGAIVEWKVPSGVRRFKILDVQHQTEKDLVA